MPPLSLICSKILITLDLDESVTYRETDGRTDQQTDGQTDALIGIQRHILKLYGQVPTHICRGTHVYVAAHASVGTRTHIYSHAHAQTEHTFNRRC